MTQIQSVTQFRTETLNKKDLAKILIVKIKRFTATASFVKGCYKRIKSRRIIDIKVFGLFLERLAEDGFIEVRMC